MTGRLVGPLPTVRFRDGARIVADPPRSTMDLRYVVCSDHRTACDCREAELSEQLADLRYDRDEATRVEQAIAATLRIHSRNQAGYCRGCHNHHPCPTRTLLLPHSWIVRFEESHPL